MKSTNTTLINFLRAAQSMAMADLYTITLNGGATLRWSSADVPVTYGGNTFGLGPLVSDSGVQSKVGVEVSTTDITFASSASFTIGGVPFVDWVQAGGFDGATIRIDRVFAPDWPTMLTAPLGGYLRFLGRYDGAKDLGNTSVTITASDWRVLLTRNIPQDCYQTSCRNVLGDSKCQFATSTLTVAGIAVTAVTSPGIFAATSSLGAHKFSLGTLAFTTGANAGLSRTIKSYDGAGNFTLTSPFPASPAVGDLFTAGPGCDLTMATCAAFRPSTWYNYFRGEPFIPSPTTGLPT
jgi:uncharacterized phage protein (TIGR02218 family)